MRIEDWKGVKVEMKTNLDSKWELYNLKTDRNEVFNVAAEHPEIVNKIDSLHKTAHRHPHIREWEFVDPKFKK